MTKIEFQLDPQAMREATNQAILGLLTPELKDQLLVRAIASLLQPSTDAWNRGKSPLDDAFERAVHIVARDMILAYIKDDVGIMSMLAELASEAGRKVLSADSGKLAERMADAFVASIRRD